MPPVRRPVPERPGLRERQHLAAIELAALYDVGDRRERAVFVGGFESVDHLVVDAAHEPPADP